MSAQEYVYRYPAPSRLTGGGRPELRLATSGGPAVAPHLFRGRVLRPRLTALLLTAVSRVVESRHHVPPAMLGRILLEADPVVTCGDGRVRFEGFSACAGLHAMTTLLPDSLDGDVASPGTTNVDFNPPLRAALARVRDGDVLGLRVGLDEVAIDAGGGEVVERKVKLPKRWLRSFAEVQAVLARMEPRLELSGAALTRLARSLPRSSTAKQRLFVSPAGAGARLGAVDTGGSVPIVGAERLRILEAVAPLCEDATVYADEAGASAWVLDFGDRRFTLTVSPEVWRGFSGEGGLLATLAAPPSEALVARVHAALRWRSGLAPEGIARELGATADEVRASLLLLGARGIVGHDIAEDAAFHRELPFDLAVVERLNPRLAAARELVDRVAPLPDGRFRVPGSAVTHTVASDDSGGFTCTCPWYAKHTGDRGPCKHVLAVSMRSER